jgi:hypothetical protein
VTANQAGAFFRLVVKTVKDASHPPGLREQQFAIIAPQYVGMRVCHI